MEIVIMFRYYAFSRVNCGTSDDDGHWGFCGDTMSTRKEIQFQAIICDQYQSSSNAIISPILLCIC
jgi:hypothetical protein